MYNLNENTITAEFLRHIQDTPNPRSREIIGNLATHLQDFAREVRDGRAPRVRTWRATLWRQVRRVTIRDLVTRHRVKPVPFRVGQAVQFALFVALLTTAQKAPIQGLLPFLLSVAITKVSPVRTAA